LQTNLATTQERMKPMRQAPKAMMPTCHTSKPPRGIVTVLESPESESSSELSSSSSSLVSDVIEYVNFSLTE
jgi:hypothetical protein